MINFALGSLAVTALFVLMGYALLKPDRDDWVFLVLGLAGLFGGVGYAVYSRRF